MPVSIARTGYTGEDGVEVFFRGSDAVKFWNTVLDKGERFGIEPCGLGARDTLRLEMCYPLNGSDLSPERNPIEAGLGFFVDLTKPKFIGRDVLRRTKESGLTNMLVILSGAKDLTIGIDAFATHVRIDEAKMIEDYLNHFTAIARSLAPLGMTAER